MKFFTCDVFERIFYSRTEGSHVQFCFIECGAFSSFYDVIKQTRALLCTRNVKPSPLTVRFEISIDSLEIHTHTQPIHIHYDWCIN